MSYNELAITKITLDNTLPTFLKTEERATSGHASQPLRNNQVNVTYSIRK